MFSIFLIYTAKSISSEHFCLEGCWLDWPVFGPREGLGLGVLLGGTWLLEDGQDEAHPQQKQIFLTTIVSQSNSLPSTTRNEELLEVLLYFNSFQHIRRIRHIVRSTNEKKDSPWSKTTSHSRLHYWAAVCSVKCQTKPSHPPSVWVPGSLILSALTIKTSLFHTDLFFFFSPCKILFVNWRKRRCLGLKGATPGCGMGWGSQGEARRELLCRVLSWELSK